MFKLLIDMSLITSETCLSFLSPHSEILPRVAKSTQNISLKRTLRKNQYEGRGVSSPVSTFALKFFSRCIFFFTF